MGSGPSLFCQHQQLPPPTELASLWLPLPSRQDPSSYQGQKAATFGCSPGSASLVQIYPSALDTLSGLPSCLLFLLAKGPWTLLLASFLGLCSPSGPCALRALGSDVGLSSMFLYIHALPCGQFPLRQPPFIYVWDSLACSSLTQVISVG